MSSKDLRLRIWDEWKLKAYFTTVRVCRSCQFEIWPGIDQFLQMFSALQYSGRQNHKRPSVRRQRELCTQFLPLIPWEYSLKVPSSLTWLQDVSESYTHNFPRTSRGLIYREDGGTAPVRNVNNSLPVYTMQYRIRPESLFSRNFFFCYFYTVFVSFVSADMQLLSEI
jgi:hypothetical protein